MMKHVLAMLSLCVVAIYLFVTAPPPLPDDGAGASDAPRIPVRVLLDSSNLVNAAARKIYTERIVTLGQEAGFAFGEDWREPDVEAGPLPALFLRMVATQLREQGSPLGLFLGSDRPINPSNAFRGEQVRQFSTLKEDRKPRYFAMSEQGLQVALYADIAAAPGCVSCHNDHPRTPKRDWSLGDVMGAATWTHPKASVTDRELRQEIGQVYAAIEQTYSAYLDKARRFRDPPLIGSVWPEKGKRQLPDQGTFMAAVREATALQILNTAVLLP